ncbi:MAG: hypothetical protein HY855_09560 [Burkholderiales bacterium]|nr:hypothetical protein [Burkholderiales bacterium]
MLIKSHATALAAAALLAACGGGSGSEPAQPAAAAAQRNRPLAVGIGNPVAPDEAARQLLDFAEGAFKSQLPERQATMVTGPARYRVYSNGTVLGVAVGSGPNYLLDGVYVMGGAFGSAPQFVGLLTSFITPVQPGSGATGPSNGCHDLDLAGTTGTQTAVTYEYTGQITGNKTVLTQVVGPAMFEALPAVETLVKTSGVLIVDGLPASASAEIRNFHQKTAAGEITHLGSTVATTASTTDYSAATTIKTVYAPAWQDRSAALAQGQTLSADWQSQITRVTTYSIPGFPPTTNTYGDAGATTLRYIGRESLTLPGGTYSTCRFERINMLPGGGWTTEWWLVGTGLLLKSVQASGHAVQTMRAISLSMNGNPL